MVREIRYSCWRINFSDDDCRLQYFSLLSVSSVERSHNQQWHRQAESEEWQEHIGEIGDGEDGHGGDTELLDDRGSVDEDGQDADTTII